MPAVGNSPGWAELMIPLQGMEISKIQISAPQKTKGPGVPPYAQDRPLANLSYHDNYLHLPCLSVLTPFLTILDWDSSTGKLELMVPQGSPTHTKLTFLQDYILNTIQAHQRSWFGTSEYSTEDFRKMFQPILNGDKFTIYLHGPNPELKPTGRVWVWANKNWTKGAKDTSFQAGETVRVALRLQGVCFLYQPHRIKFRIQHQTVAIYKKSL